MTDDSKIIPIETASSTDLELKRQEYLEAVKAYKKRQMIISAIVLPLYLVGLLRTGFPTHPNAANTMLLLIVLMLLMRFEFNRPNRSKQLLLIRLDELGRSNNVMVIPEMLKAYRLPRAKGVITISRNALTQLLSQVNQQNKPQLTQTNWKHMFSILLEGDLRNGIETINKWFWMNMEGPGDIEQSKLEIRLAIIDVIGRIGSYDGIQPLRKVIARSGEIEHGEILASRAREALLNLQTRLEANKAPEQLLRASSKGEEESDLLLRPAGYAQSAEESLLRPIGFESDGHKSESK